MAVTTISDLWTPDIWVKETKERQEKFANALNSGIVVSNPEFDAIATGAGVTAHVPFFKDTTDDDDEIQVEDTAPTDGEATAGIQICPILNRVKSYRVTALAKNVSGGDPVGHITGQMAEGRMKRRQKTFISTLRGAFNGLGANGAAAPLLANRVDSFDESGLDATSDQIMNSDLFITAKALLGELSNDLQMGAIITHSNVIAALERADKNSFKNGVESGLPFTVRTYREVPIFACDELVRAATSDAGFVYETYIAAKGTVAMGSKAQQGDTADVASMQYFLDREKNNERIWDRTRFVIHINGMKWVGTPSGQSATNTELATAANWNLVYSSAKRTGMVCIRTNG